GCGKVFRRIRRSIVRPGHVYLSSGFSGAGPDGGADRGFGVIVQLAAGEVIEENPDVCSACAIFWHGAPESSRREELLFFGMSAPDAHMIIVRCVCERADEQLWLTAAHRCGEESRCSLREHGALLSRFNLC